jgi:hypothetical protein
MPPKGLLSTYYMADTALCDVIRYVGGPQTWSRESLSKCLGGNQRWREAPSFTTTNTVFKKLKRPAVATHTCNPSYLGGKDQEDHYMRLTQQKAQDLNLKNN